jgi:glutamine---fructose-6-phosphate transaminase (isomerizing)
MCGIFGLVAQRDQAPSVVLEGLRYLEYRGYDSWGIAVAQSRAVVCDKQVGHITGATTTLPASQIALGHTRWATHGAVTQANAHPHVDCGGRFALIHNGIVENYRELGGLLRRKHTFRSQTDTEILVHLLEEQITEAADFRTALMWVFRQVEGLSAIAVLDAHTGQLVVAKNGSPLVLGWGDSKMYLASDPIALLDHTTDVTFLEDGQAASISATGAQIFDIESGSQVAPQITKVSWDTRYAGLNGYQHFMLKEIHEQPLVLQQIASEKRAAAEGLAELLRLAGDVYLIGCGTAYHAAMSARYTLAEIAGVKSTAVVASEMSLITPLLGPESLVLAFSQSGETLDVLEAVRAARQRGARVAALTNGEGSALHRSADFTVLLGCGPERCVLATKSYTAMLALMELSSWAIAGETERGALAIHEAGLRLDCSLKEVASTGSIHKIAQEIVGHQHLFLLGRHRNYPFALEAALKIKEVSYLHAEGFAAGELKHGVIALVTNGTPCLLLAPDEDYRREVLAAAAEVRARGALTIGFSPRMEEEFDRLVHIGHGASAPYEIAALTQLLAYELSILRGCDPDKPRNLAKSVTVK